MTTTGLNAIQIIVPKSENTLFVSIFLKCVVKFAKRQEHIFTAMEIYQHLMKAPFPFIAARNGTEIDHHFSWKTSKVCPAQSKKLALFLALLA